MSRKGTKRSAYSSYVSRKPKPSPAGRVLARCGLCRGEGKADGKGSPVVIRHARNCPEHHLNRNSA